MKTEVRWYNRLERDSFEVIELDHVPEVGDTLITGLHTGQVTSRIFHFRPNQQPEMTAHLSVRKEN